MKMKMTRSILFFAALCLGLSCLAHAGRLPVASPEDVGMSSEKLALVKPAVQALVDKEKIVGASVSVARKGQVVFFETFGMMNRQTAQPVERDTIFRFYSMTKPITSVAVMMLYEEGKLKLDEPVSNYIPEFKGLKVYAKSGEHTDQDRPMTVRDLLRHTSGLTYGFFGNTAVDKMYRAAGVLKRGSSLQDMADKLGEIPLLNQPGTKWHYSVSTDVLGHLVEKLSGQPLNRFFRKRIFKPLQMKDTAFHVAAAKAKRFAACYSPKAGGGLRLTDDPAKSKFLTQPSLLSGGGGLVSTAADYMTFCRMLLNKGQLDGKRLLRSETVEMMTSNQLPDGVSRGSGGGFGLGFSVRTGGGKSPKGEYGWGGAASTHFWISPKDELIVIALSQHMPYSGRLENTVKPIVYDSISTDSQPQTITKSRKPITSENFDTIVDIQWTLKKMTVKGRQYQLTGKNPSVKFDKDGKVTGLASVNRYFGSMKIDGKGKVQWPSPFGSTRMAGSGALMKQEHAYLNALPKTNRISTEGTNLHASSEDAQTELVFSMPDK